LGTADIPEVGQNGANDAEADMTLSKTPA
jgi:hypothetical protein